MASFDTADAEPLRSGATSTRRAAELLALPDEALLEAFQRQTFGYFWEGAHGPERTGTRSPPLTARARRTGDIRRLGIRAHGPAGGGGTWLGQSRGGTGAFDGGAGSARTGTHAPWRPASLPGWAQRADHPLHAT